MAKRKTKKEWEEELELANAATFNGFKEFITKAKEKIAELESENRILKSELDLYKKDKEEDELKQQIRELNDTIEEKDEEITYYESLELRSVTPENLREEFIAERFAEFFSYKDYKRLENMLDLYELL